MSLCSAAPRSSPTIPSIMREVSAESRPGRRFEPTTERQLDADLLALAIDLPGAADGVSIAREFPGARGVPDVIAVTRWRDQLQRRAELRAPFLTNETDCAVVAALAWRQTRTPRVVGLRLGMSEDQVARRLRALTATGHVSAVGSGYRRAFELVPIGRAYALEAKVSDWQKGIAQAFRYSTWCDAAALVLLRSPRDLTEVEIRCRGLGLGLAIGRRWVTRPRLGRPHAGMRLALSERWAQLLLSSESL